MIEENLLHVRYDGKLCILHSYRPNIFLMKLVSGFDINCGAIVPSTHTPHRISRQERLNNTIPKKFKI